MTPLTLRERVEAGVFVVLVVSIAMAMGALAGAIFFTAAVIAAANPLATIIVGAIAGVLMAVKGIRTAWEEE